MNEVEIYGGGERLKDHNRGPQENNMFGGCKVGVNMVGGRKICPGRRTKQQTPGAAGDKRAFHSKNGTGGKSNREHT